MRVYRYDPSKKPEPRPAVMPKLPHCADCGKCLGEAAPYRQRYCRDCEPHALAVRVERHRRKHARV